MIKKIALLLFLLPTLFTFNVAVADDDEDLEEYEDVSMEEETENNLNADPVYLNDGADFVNVKQFDISGVMLGMSYDDVSNLFFDNTGLYAPRRKNSVIYTINKEWKYNLDYECRQQNIFIPDQLEKCIYSLAKGRGLLYVSEIHLERQQTGEKIDVYLTSNATDNVVYKIIYTNDAADAEGDSEKFANQREKKLLSFWQGVLDKYGEPNSGEDKWISSETAYTPVMQAFYGQLILEDKGLESNDSSENIIKARENFQAKPYAF